MRHKVDEKLSAQITRLQNLKKDYELIKIDAEKELQLMRQYKNNPNKEIVKKAVEGEERALSVVAYYEGMISQVEKEIADFLKS